MNLLDKYLYKKSIFYILAIVLFFTALMWINSIFSLAAFGVSKGISVGKLMSILILTIPYILSKTVDIGSALGILVTLRLFQYSNESIAVSSVGAGAFKIYRSIFALSAVVGILSLFLMNYVLPESYKAFKNKETIIYNSVNPGLFQPMTPVIITDQAYSFMLGRSPRGVMSGVSFIYYSQGGVSALFAQGGEIVNDNANEYFKFLQTDNTYIINIFSYDEENISFHSSHMDQYLFNLNSLSGSTIGEPRDVRLPIRSLSTDSLITDLRLLRPYIRSLMSEFQQAGGSSNVVTPEDRSLLAYLKRNLSGKVKEVNDRVFKSYSPLLFALISVIFFLRSKFTRGPMGYTYMVQSIASALAITYISDQGVSYLYMMGIGSVIIINAIIILLMILGFIFLEKVTQN